MTAMFLNPFIQSLQRHSFSNRLISRNSLMILGNRDVEQFTQVRLKSFFITTPIFYVNAEPHIGHLYSACLADARHRWEKVKGNMSVFSTGTDEHGMKVQKAADLNGKSPIEYCEEVSSKFKSLFDVCDINYTSFVRTTDRRHIDTVNHIWEKLKSGGYIYRGEYTGWYSVQDEAFLTPLQVEDKPGHTDGTVKVSKESGHVVEWTKEENYVFKLSHFKEELRRWIQNNDVIRPVNFRPLVDRWLDDLPDLSVSRESRRLPWGIPVPDDPTQTIYVWLDALANYLTVSGYQSNSIWPPDCHVLGKDILKFHSVYWPAFLMAMGLEPPRSIFCHSHWTVDGVKMSKSLGNVVDPVKRLERFTSDGMRYFLLKEGVPHNDGNYNDRKAVELVNADLCNTLGNLLRRCTAVKLHPDQSYPVKGETCDDEWMKDLYQLAERVDEEFSSLYFYRGLDMIVTRLKETNALLQHRQVWTLQSPHLDSLLYQAMENLRVCAILLQPVVPGLARGVLNRLGVSNDTRGYKDCLHEERGLPRKLGKDTGAIFPRIR